MNNLRIMAYALALSGMTALAGCSQKQAEAPGAEAGQTAQAPTSATPASNVVLANPQGSVKVGGEAVCVICNRNEGKTYVEPVAATLDYKGKTYAFCNEGEKAEFISNPAKYAQAE